MAKGRNTKIIWILVVAVALLGIGYLKFTEQSNPTSALRHDLEKTGAGSIIDFTENGNKIHRAVDEALRQNNLAVQDTKDMMKEVPRQKVEGLIRWHTRQLLVNIPSEMAAEKVQEALQKVVQGSGGQVILAEPDKYQGVPVIRLDIGLKDKIAGDDITIISDRVYLAKGKTVTINKEPEVKGSGQMAIVIDDFGYSSEPIEAFAAIHRPMTFAILPYRPFSNEAAARGLSSGQQIILHLPMEPLDQAEQSEKLTITVAMKEHEIQEMTRKAIQSIPGLIGVNNHQGSRATADKRVMKTVLGELKNNNLFFLDSHTNGQSIAADTARQLGVKTGQNQLFIDNTDSVAAVKGKLRTAQEIASSNGSIIVIGHARMNTARAISEMISELEKKGIKLVFVSQMLK